LTRLHGSLPDLSRAQPDQEQQAESTTAPLHAHALFTAQKRLQTDQRMEEILEFIHADMSGRDNSK
jgi:hypothetical protein